MTQVEAFPFTTDDCIRRARIDARLTPNELAIALDCNYQTVLRWENGTKIPSGRNLVRLIAVTGAQWLPQALESARTRNRCFATDPGQTARALAA